MKISIIVLLAGMPFLTACSKDSSSIVVQVVEVAHIADVPGGAIHVLGKTRNHNAVEIEREYEEEIKPGIVIRTIATQTSYTYVYPDGIRFFEELRQSDGNTVTFDCERVADKILDRDLVPLAVKQCRVIREVATQFFKNQPTEFVDDRGRTWELKH